MVELDPTSIFLGENNQIFFGNLSHYFYNHKINFKTGFVSPEIFKLDNEKESTDIYSLGCIIFYILFDKIPYDDIIHSRRRINFVKNINIINYYENNENKLFSELFNSYKNVFILI